ncbi:unnamed protein product [Closterium sp. NIES-53]
MAGIAVSHHSPLSHHNLPRHLRRHLLQRLLRLQLLLLLQIRPYMQALRIRPCSRSCSHQRSTNTCRNLKATRPQTATLKLRPRHQDCAWDESAVGAYDDVADSEAGTDTGTEAGIAADVLPEGAPGVDDDDGRPHPSSENRDACPPSPRHKPSQHKRNEKLQWLDVKWKGSQWWSERFQKPWNLNAAVAGDACHHHCGPDRRSLGAHQESGVPEGARDRHGDFPPDLFTALGMADVVVAVHPNGWMDADGVMHWLDECIKPFTRPRFGRQAKSAMVVMDSYRGYLTEAVKEKFADLDIVLAVIPSGCTAEVQPLNVSIKKSFKASIRQQYQSWFEEEGQERLTPAGNIKKPPSAVVLRWILRAWKAVPPELSSRPSSPVASATRLTAVRTASPWRTGGAR